MSTVIEIHGNTYKEREAFLNELTGGLRFSHSDSSVTCFREDTDDGMGSDRPILTIVYGERRVMTLLPSDDFDFELGEQKCLVSDFAVVLDEADGFLCKLRNKVPHYNGDLATIKLFIAARQSVFFAIAVFLFSLLLDCRWWSILFAVLGSLTVLVYYRVLEYRVHAVVAAIRGSFYIWKQVHAGVATRQDYRTLVSCLAKADDRDIANIHSILRHLV